MRIPAIFFLGFAVTLLAGCALRPQHEFDSQASFSDLKTFQWLEPEHTQEGVNISDPVLDSPLLGRRVEQAVQTVLQEQGFQPAESDPDFLVTYHTTENEREYRGSYMQLGFGQYRPRFGSSVLVDVWPRTFKEGTLIIDVVDAESGDLIWRGWRDTELTRRNFSEERVIEAVRYILSAFPPES